MSDELTALNSRLEKSSTLQSNKGKNAEQDKQQVIHNKVNKIKYKIKVVLQIWTCLNELTF